MFIYKQHPRFSETDGLGHVSNTALPVWFEEARTEVFRIFNPTLSLDTWNLILRRQDIEFQQQIFHNREVEVETAVEAIGTTSCTLRHRARQGGRQVAEARCVLVHFDYQRQRPAPIPDEIRRELERHPLDVE